MEKVYEGVGLCPVCGNKTLRVELFRYDLPVEGPSIIFVGRCSRCGAKFADVIPLEVGKEKTVTYKVTGDLLGKIVFLPGDSEVSIPELGVELKLTPAFKGRITTIEGILRMIADDTPSEEVKKEIEKIINGEKTATIVIKDRSGMFKEIDPSSRA